MSRRPFRFRLLCFRYEERNPASTLMGTDAFASDTASLALLPSEPLLEESRTFETDTPAQESSRGIERSAVEPVVVSQVPSDLPKAVVDELFSTPDGFEIGGFDPGPWLDHFAGFGSPRAIASPAPAQTGPIPAPGAGSSTSAPTSPMMMLQPDSGVEPLDSGATKGHITSDSSGGAQANRQGPNGQQQDVTSVTTDAGEVVTLEAPGHALRAVRAHAAPQQSGASFPYGWFSFEIGNVTPGGSATVRMTLPEGAAPSGYFKQDIGGHLSRFDFDGSTGAEIAGNVVTLHYVDGGRGDDDGLANGVIVDPGGPGHDSFFVILTTVDSLASEPSNFWSYGQGRFRVTRIADGPITPELPLAVSYSIGGTATNGLDYTELSGTVVIPAGMASADIIVDPLDDELVEPIETVVATLQPGAGYVVHTPNSGTVQIYSDNTGGGGGGGPPPPPPGGSLPTVGIVASDPDAFEQGLDPGQFSVSRDGDLTNGLTVSYSVSGAATPDQDYYGLSGSVLIPAGQASATFDVNPLDDVLIEGQEDVVATLVPSATYQIALGAETAPVWIADNDTVDLDIDSDNNNGLGPPDRSVAEDGIEDDPALPGKFVGTNVGDKDADGVPDFADGFNWDGVLGNGDDVNAQDGFTPLVLEAEAGVDLNVAKFKFSYSASDPSGVTLDANGTYSPAEGHSRIWKKDGALARDKAKANEGGDYVAPEVYTGVQLGLTGQTRVVTLYVEAIAPSSTPGDQRIAVEVDPDGDGPADFGYSDAVRATVRWVDAEVDTADTLEDQPVTINVLANDVGPDLRVIDVTQPYHGTVVLNPDDTITYTPNSNANGGPNGFYGLDQFSYTISDGQVVSDTTVVWIWVDPVDNLAPVADHDLFYTDLDTAATISGSYLLANDSDANGDSLTIQVVQLPAHGALVPDGFGNWTYTPDPGYSGVDGFAYQVLDGAVNSATALVAVGVAQQPKIEKLDTKEISQGGMKVGELSVQYVPDSGAIAAIWTSLVPQGKATQGEAAKKWFAHHFNWYQIATAATYLPVDAAGTRLTVPYVDPPPGGLGRDPNINNAPSWADKLAWYWNEQKGPPPGFQFSTTPLAKMVQGAKLIFADIPFNKPLPNQSTTFKTWLVALDQKAQIVKFLQAFTWDWSNPGGKNKITSAAWLPGSPADEEYKDIIGGFDKSL